MITLSLLMSMDVNSGGMSFHPVWSGLADLRKTRSISQLELEIGKRTGKINNKLLQHISNDANYNPSLPCPIFVKVGLEIFKGGYDYNLWMRGQVTGVFLLSVGQVLAYSVPVFTRIAEEEE